MSLLLANNKMFVFIYRDLIKKYRLNHYISKRKYLLCTNFTKTAIKRLSQRLQTSHFHSFSPRPMDAATRPKLTKYVYYTHLVLSFNKIHQSDALTLRHLFDSRLLTG